MPLQRHHRDAGTHDDAQHDADHDGDADIDGANDSMEDSSPDCKLFDGQTVPIFRKQFLLESLPSKVKASAKGENTIQDVFLHVSGLGYYDVAIDGVVVLFSF